MDAYEDVEEDLKTGSYNPLKKKEPDVSLPAEKRKAGGLGIFMMKNSRLS